MKQVLGRIITALLVFSMVALGTPLAEAQQPFYPGSQGIVAPVYPFATKTLAAGGNQVWTLGSGMSGFTIQVTGTYSASNFNIQGSVDGTNYTTLALLPVSGGQLVLTQSGASTAVNGSYYVQNISSFKSLKFLLNSFTGTSISVQPFGSLATGLTTSFGPLPADPCQDKNFIKSSAVINVGTATTGVVVPAVTGKQTWVCDIQATLAGTTPTVQLKIGTQTTNPCDTAATNLSGALAPVAGTQLFWGWGGAVYGPPQIPVANQVCATTSGTGSSFQGSVSFVQI